jgi:hypothetical protein
MATLSDEVVRELTDAAEAYEESRRPGTDGTAEALRDAVLGLVADATNDDGYALIVGAVLLGISE